MQSLIPRYFKILQELLLFFGCFLVFAWLELRLFTSNLVGLFSTLPTAGSGGSWTGAGQSIVHPYTHISNTKAVLSRSLSLVAQIPNLPISIFSAPTNFPYIEKVWDTIPIRTHKFQFEVAQIPNFPMFDITYAYCILNWCIWQIGPQPKSFIQHFPTCSKYFMNNPWIFGYPLVI